MPVCPRPEYPRPQLIRKEWMCLNGEWEFAIAESEGAAEGWIAGEPLPDRIVVPFAYQTQLSGVHDHGMYERVWYARSFELPAHWADGEARDLLLHFGAVDYRSTVWVNGREVGHNQGGHVPFSFDISPFLRDGENRLLVRVEDPQDSHQPRGKQATSGKPAGCDYYCTTGIWQSVWLEPVPVIRVDSIRLTPFLATGAHPDGIELRVFLHAPSAGWRLEADLRDGDRVVAHAQHEAAGATARLVLLVPGARRWSPEDPFLYALQIRLLDGDKMVDQVDSYAAIRVVRCREGRVWLNEKPVFLAMVLDQGYWPDGGMTAPSDEALRADVEWCLKLGFNGARKHQKVEDPRWLYWCDHLGLLVWGEMPNARAWSTRAEELFLAEWERALRRDVNHPCIITWVPINESWGAPDLHRNHPGQYAFVERTVAVTRRLDPERPVVDNDGWEHTDVSDICALHDYTVDPEELRSRYEETLQTGLPPGLSWGKYPKRYFAEGASYRGQPIVLSEVGGLLMVPDEPGGKLDWLYGIYGSCRTADQLLQQYEAFMNELLQFPFLAGFCYTQLTDIEQETNGLLSYSREPKVDPSAITAIHRRFFERETPAEPG